MNRNTMNAIEIIADISASLDSSRKVKNFIMEMLTEAELETLSKRWRILEMLAEGRTQRAIAEELQVSLCKVTRGSKILKNKNSIAAEYLTKGKNNEQK